MTYIVINENEIVKAEMKTESNHWKKCDCLMCIALKQDLASLPRIPIEGKHKWEVWQSVPESEIKIQRQAYDFDEKIWFDATLYVFNKAVRTRIVAIPIQPTPEGEKDAEKTVSQMAEIIQKECHSLVSAVMKESKKRITVQDATNAYMFHKLAELQSRINQLEQSSSITLLTNDNTQTP